MSIMFKSKIPPWADVFPQIKNIVQNPMETPFCVSIPYGFQLQKEIWNPEQLRVVLHVNTGSGHSFISHYGVGKKNEINIWNFSKDKQPGNLANAFQTISTDLKFLHILFLQRRWIYVMYCTDLSMRIFSAKFHSLSTTMVDRTVLSLAYNEIRDEIITGIAGGIMTWKFPIGQTDPLIPGQLISCSFKPLDWVMSMTLDNVSKQILAISDVRISMIDVASHKERCFFHKKYDISFTTCVFYNPASYFITGDQNGSIRAWSTSINSFPMVTQFLGHTAAITKLLVHPKEPLLISSSLDKTIRVWNFDTSTQTFRLETGEEIIEMELLSGDLLYYHSRHHMKIWSLNLFHSLFTSLSSRIRKWTRVKSPGYPARILLHAEDGGVRLVSPVHGYELTTVLPTTTMTADIVDVAHDPRQEKIYLVLSTREVLVFESDTNPCCAYQLWAAECPDEGVCSLAMTNAEFALNKNEIPLKSGLLFAGHYNGQISLVSSKDVYMKENVQAHQGQVTFLRVSASFSESRDSLASYDHLVSCGTDCTVRVWQLIHREIIYVSIQQMALVKLLQLPRDLAMAGNTLCMAMADNSVVMCRVREESKESGAKMFNTAKNTHEFLTHSKDEGHTAPINGLTCCSTLGLFATSSEDQCVKIWNCDNQLVREMCFDESLCGVCFANSRGDILVGFQSHISLVTILNYLPLPYLEILSTMYFDNDHFEDHVHFDDLLKFWYDPEHVPRMPLEASKRRPLEPPELKIPNKKKTKETVIVRQKTEEEEMIDLFQKRRASRRLSSEVHVMMALRRLSAPTPSNTTLAQTVNAWKSQQQEEGESTENTEPHDGEVAPTLSTEHEPAKVYWPCAPDGFIPNSVVRNRVKPRKPPARLIPRVKRPEKKKKEVIEKEEEEDEHKSKIKDFWTLWRAMQAEHVKKTIREEEFKKKGSEGRKRRKVSQPASSSKLGRRLKPRARTSQNISEGFDEEEEMEEIVEEEEEETEPEVIDEFLEEEEEDYYEDISVESAESGHEESGVELVVETPEELEEESEEETIFIDTDESSPSESGSTTSVMKLEIKSSESSLLTRIPRKEWYHNLAQAQLVTPSIEEIIENMLIALSKMDSLDGIQDICKEFENVEREFGIPEDKKVQIQNQLIKLSYHEDAVTRRAGVWALGDMEVQRQDAILTVVRRLIDNDMETREEAKTVLKNLTGVETKEGLSKLMMDMGVDHLNLACSDNAVLLELAVRLRHEREKNKANMTERAEDEDNEKTNLDDLRTILRRRPFKAKLRHPKTMGRRLRDASRSGHRPPSILEEPASLPNTDWLKNTLKRSRFGCKLLQKMEAFRQDIIPGYTPPSSNEIEREYSLEIGEPQQAEQDATDRIQRDRLVISSDGETVKSLESTVDRKRIDIPVDSPDRNEGRTRECRTSPGWIVQEPRQEPRKKFIDEIATQASDDQSLELLSPPQVFKVMDCLGLNQRKAMISSDGETVKSLESTVDRKGIDIPVDSPDRNEGRTRECRTSPGWIVLEPRQEPRKKFIDEIATQASDDQSLELLSLPQVFKVMDCLGLNQRKAMLQLLKMKRTKRIIPVQENNTTQESYSAVDLMEIICQLPPFDEVLENLARKASRSKEEILLNMRGLFRSESLSVIERGNYAAINGLGGLPSRYQELLLPLRNEVLRSIEGIFGNAKPLVSRRTGVAMKFKNAVEGILGFCATLEPEMEDEDQFSCVTLQETWGQYIGPRTSLQTDAAKQKKDENIPPIFVQPSLQQCLGPGTHGQRLLKSTIIRAKALSDSRLLSSRQTQDFVVTSLPHRLSIHTGKKIKGESRYGIMELSWRAGTPLPQLNEETTRKSELVSNFPLLPCKPVELKIPFVSHSHGIRPQIHQQLISKSQSVPPLNHRKVKPFAEKRLNLFRAINSLNKQDSLVALDEYIKNRNIVRKKFMDKKGNLLPGSCTVHPRPPNSATPISAPPSRLKNDSMTSVRSGVSSESGSPLCEVARNMTRDTLLRELNKFHLPPISRFGGVNRSL